MNGASAITSFTDGTDAANTCNELYPGIRNGLLTQYPWSFGLKKVQLARTLVTPVNEWTYEYQLPSDRLGPPRAVFSGLVAGSPILRGGWEIYADKLLTDETVIAIDYQYVVSEAAMPTYFVQLLKYMMAWHLALPITDQPDKAEYWRTIAVGTPAENNRGGYFRVATSIDSQGNLTPVIDDYSLTSVRN